MLNGQNTTAVSTELDFFHVLLNSFSLDDVSTKTAKMPAKSDLAPFAANILPGHAPIFSSMVDAVIPWPGLNKLCKTSHV